MSPLFTGYRTLSHHQPVLIIEHGTTCLQCCENTVWKNMLRKLNSSQKWWREGSHILLITAYMVQQEEGLFLLYCQQQAALDSQWEATTNSNSHIPPLNFHSEEFLLTSSFPLYKNTLFLCSLDLRLAIVVCPQV